MSRSREGEAAASEATPAGAASNGAPSSDVELQSSIGSLVDLAGSVLRALHGQSTRVPESVLVPLGAHAEAKIDLAAAQRAQAELHALRMLLQDYADGIELASKSKEALAGADLLRRLLEGILQTRLTLAGEEGRGSEAPTAEEYNDALTDAAALAPSNGSGSDSENRWRLRNLTSHPLRLPGADGIAWDLPAYSETILEDHQKRMLDLRAAEASGQLRLTLLPSPVPTQYTFLAALVWILPILVILGIVFSWPWWAWLAVGVGVLVLVGGGVMFQKGENREHLWNIAGELPAATLQTLTYLLVVVIAVGLPAAAIIFGADVRTVARNVVQGDASAVEYLTAVARTMQIIFIAIASMLPALLYFQFDRDRLSTLREKFVHQIFRLDSAMRTEGAIAAKYGRLIDEVYGPERSGRFRRLTRGRRAPIFVATLLIMLGWLYVLLNPDVGLVGTESGTAQLFVPRQTAVAFAFLGAYFFTLFALLRGYVRRDLRPKSYSDISVRLIAVAILAWVLELLFNDDSTGLFVFAFLTGLVPQAALNKIREVAQLRWSLRGKNGSDTGSGGSGGGGGDGGSDDFAVLDDPLPLTDIVGIDLYDRTRLASEGVTNIEALAHNDLVDLMLQTRIPVPRLVDWTDQAILHLHVSNGDRAKLHEYGIRTATDLICAREQANARGDLQPFLQILDANGSATPSRMEVIIDAMKDEEWIDSLLFWRGHGATTRMIARHAAQATGIATRGNGPA
jgi:hypothetical protein